MTDHEEIMMPVPKPEAVHMAEIHALRQISDSLSATNRALNTLAADLREVRADVREVREKVIRMEGEDLKGEMREMKGDMKALGKRVDALETIRDRQDGAMGVGAWLTKHAPWLVALVMAGLAGLGLKYGSTST